MTFVLQSKHISPSGTVVKPIPMDLKELNKQRLTEKKAPKIEITQASAKE
jgi:hypothetical protein